MDGKKLAMQHMGEDAAPKKKAKLHVHKVEVERGHSGGHVIHHHMKDEDGNDHGRQGPHVVANNDDMHANLDEAMGDQPAAGEGQAPGVSDPAEGQEENVGQE